LLLDLHGTFLLFLWFARSGAQRWRRRAHDPRARRDTRASLVLKTLFDSNRCLAASRIRAQARTAIKAVLAYGRAVKHPREMFLAFPKFRAATGRARGDEVGDSCSKDPL
jgi:hypothetical protein